MALGGQLARTLKANGVAETSVVVSEELSNSLSDGMWTTYSHFDKTFRVLIEEFAALLSGVALGNYNFQRKGAKEAEKDKESNGESENAKDNLVKSINFVHSRFNSTDEQTNFLLNTVKYTLLARELTNERANVANTEVIHPSNIWSFYSWYQYFLKLAQDIQKENADKVKIQSIVGADLEKEGLNLLYNVGKGSKNPPILINLSYQGRYIVLVCPSIY